jgi:hypothetical protein
MRTDWYCGWATAMAAKHERDAARLRTRAYGFREPPDLAILKRRLIVAQNAYDDARVALMATAVFEKAGVRWKWKQMQDLITRRSEWEHELATDEARLGMSQDRPEVELPAPRADPLGAEGSALVERIADVIVARWLRPTY